MDRLSMPFEFRISTRHVMFASASRLRRQKKTFLDTSNQEGGWPRLLS